MKYGVFSPGHGPFGHLRSPPRNGASENGYQIEAFRAPITRHGGEDVKWERSYDVGRIRTNCQRGRLRELLAHLSKGRAVILCIPSIARRMKMICAALQAPQPSARTPTRTPFSQGRPFHPKWRAHHFASCAHHFVWSRTPFCQLRKSFCLEAHIILMRALACSSRTTLPAVTAHKPTLTTDHGLLTTDHG